MTESQSGHQDVALEQRTAGMFTFLASDAVMLFLEA